MRFDGFDACDTKGYDSKVFKSKMQAQRRDTSITATALIKIRYLFSPPT